MAVAEVCGFRLLNFMWVCGHGVLERGGVGLRGGDGEGWVGMEARGGVGSATHHPPSNYGPCTGRVTIAPISKFDLPFN